MTTAGVAFDKVTKYLEKDTSGVETAHSLFDTLAATGASSEPTTGDPS